MSGREILAVGTTTPVERNDLAVGRTSSCSRPSTCRCAACCTSTIGVAPVTVIVSATDPTFSSALSGTVMLPATWIPSRLNELNPWREKVTE